MTQISQQQIKVMFDELAVNYDWFNRLSSLGLDHLWRFRTLRNIKSGMQVLDLGTGTGDLAIGAARRVGAQGGVVGLDVSPAMLRLAEQKGNKFNLNSRIQWVQRGAENIPFESICYDKVISGFVLRNVKIHIHAILRGVYAALKPGGQLSFVDLTEPDHFVIRKLSHAYLSTVVLLWGWILFRDTQPVHYLSESVKNFFRAHEFVALLKETGFTHISAKRYLFGLVTHYQAQKP